MVGLLLRLLPPILLLAAGISAYLHLSKEAPAEAKEKVENQLPVVTVRSLERVDYQVTLKTQGIVRAHDSGNLTSLVSGRVKFIHPGFETGAFFRKGDPLVELETEDLETEVIAAKARVARAQSTLLQEAARGKQAGINWKELGYTSEPSDLVLRIPQRAQAEADLAAANAEVARAERDLKRATIVAPYNGRVARREVSVGQSIGTQTALGEIFSTDRAELRMPLDRRQLDFVSLPEREGDAPLNVTLTDERMNIDVTRDALIVRTEGQLDENSRELFVIAEIEDPFGLESDVPPLRIGQPVRASVAAAVLEDVFVIEREHLRGLSEVVLVKEDDEGNERIARTILDPIWTEQDLLIVRDQLEEGDLMAVGSLTYAVNRGRVTTELEEPEPDPDDVAPARAAAPDTSSTSGA